MENAITRIEFPELFFGIVSPIGAEIAPTVDALTKFFNQENYEVNVIKVTDYFTTISKTIPPKAPLKNSPTDLRIESYIEYGNQIREEFKDNSILAAYTIFRIARERRKIIKKNPNNSYKKQVYILHQFKRKEEIDLFRSIYGRLFFQISVYSKRESRISSIAKKLAHENTSPDHNKYRSKAIELVVRDEDEKGEPRGQRVTKIFHDADFILNNDIIEFNITDQLNRFLELIFSSNSISPSKQEYGMFAAKAASLRTLDLSRQVGAAIFRRTGEILSQGSNEVPKADGGTYWTDDEPFDAREFVLKCDSNDVRKRELLKEIFEVTNMECTFDEFMNLKFIKDSQFMDALEYGRIIHAEMSAITDASRLGISIKDAILYCTTFPCHMCAKHIVASGIAKVIFLEPYPKSLAHDLHSDAINIEQGPRGTYSEFNSVEFEHFYGVTPRRYRELFERGKRKNGEKFQEYIDGKKRPNIDYKAPFYTQLEASVILQGNNALQKIMKKSSDFITEDAIN